MKFNHTLLILAIFSLSTVLNAGELSQFPDGKIEVRLFDDKGKVNYSVSLNGEAVIGPSSLGLRLDAGIKHGFLIGASREYIEFGHYITLARRAGEHWFEGIISGEKNYR